MIQKTTVFWFRRDLRLNDNVGLAKALVEAGTVQPLFIFDEFILRALKDPADARISFIHRTLQSMKVQLQKRGGDLWVESGDVLEIWTRLLAKHKISAVYTNHDYEPRARKRDAAVEELLKQHGVVFKTFKDQTLFEKSEILTDAGKPYTVYTPYKRKVLATLRPAQLQSSGSENHLDRIQKSAAQEMPSLADLGFQESSLDIPSADIVRGIIKTYDKTRDIPSLADGTSRLGLHLRFGTISVRELAGAARELNETYLSELIWRDFFMQVLWHHPQVVTKSFRLDFEKVAWRENESEFKRWCEGQTGYPLVDAGMRELNATGHMHNRVRMVVASFLTKHLLMHWLKGERYFAMKLLDYDLSANNGNWQWAAGTGCDAAPYFRVFNPTAQAEKFDPDHLYIKKWVPEFGTSRYVTPMVKHEEARGRALHEFTKALKGVKE